MAVVTVVQGRLSVFTTSDTTKPTESLRVRFPAASDATTNDAPSLLAVTSPAASTVTTVVLRDVNWRVLGVASASPAAVRTVTVSAAVVPGFIEKRFVPFGARTVIEAGPLGSDGSADDPHAAQMANANPSKSRRIRILCAALA